jgi:hypothetical protein
VVRLSFAMSSDRRRLTGSESVTFRPDRSISDLVFRLWINGPNPRADGAVMTISSVRADGMTSYALDSSETLLRIKLRSPVHAGASVHAQLAFAVTLPTHSNDRYGVSDDVAWWASAFPLLSYVRGEGFATEPATRLFAEAATSEEFRLQDLAVTAPSGDAVVANGTPGPRVGRTWHFSAASVRDVAVAVGRFRFASTSASGRPIRVAVTTTLPDSASTVADVIAAAVRDHVARFGPFPYAVLNIAVIPDLRGGIEMPGVIYLGTRQLDATPSHEVGHEWFYGLVGDDQARDPWLDEAFATYVEALDNGHTSRYLNTPVPAAGRNRVGKPMTYWEKYGENTYFRSVYLQGSAALIEARGAAGAAAFDHALRCYVNRNAHRVARPADLARALQKLPAALAVLRKFGAIG